tara:strand:- start:73 stop:252 length:180 start_codon:yes stop_codon:yes gene_type:complete
MSVYQYNCYWNYYKVRKAKKKKAQLLLVCFSLLFSKIIIRRDTADVQLKNIFVLFFCFF